MSLKQNLFPKDFQRWHDLRIDQYAEQKAIEEANKKQELIVFVMIFLQKFYNLKQEDERDIIICILSEWITCLIFHQSIQKDILYL